MNINTLIYEVTNTPGNPEFNDKYLVAVTVPEESLWGQALMAICKTECLPFVLAIGGAGYGLTMDDIREVAISEVENRDLDECVVIDALSIQEAYAKEVTESYRMTETYYPYTGRECPENCRESCYECSNTVPVAECIYSQGDELEMLNLTFSRLIVCSEDNEAESAEYFRKLYEAATKAFETRKDAIGSLSLATEYPGHNPVRFRCSDFDDADEADNYIEFLVRESTGEPVAVTAHIENGIEIYPEAMAFARAAAAITKDSAMFIHCANE